MTAAIEAQRQLRGEDTLPFAVRMGLHMGEAVDRDNNYYGTEVNRVARVLALATVARCSYPAPPKSWCAGGSPFDLWLSISYAGFAGRSRYSK